MRISCAVLGNGRRPQNLNNVPFKGYNELVLKNKLMGGSPNLSAQPCLQEMSLIFSCYKKNNFKDDLCTEELLMFQKCCEAAKKPEIIENKTGKRTLDKVAINNLLQRFPNH